MTEDEERLRQIVERLARAQRFAGAGVWDWDMRTGVIDWSPELFRLFGLDPQTVAAGFDAWRASVHPADLAAAEEQIETSIRDRLPLSSEYRVVLPDGEIRWVQALGQTRYDDSGEPTAMAGICLDITERRQAEQSLMQFQEEQQLILDSVPAMIWYKDTGNRILRVNAAAARSLGLAKEQIEGRSTADFYPNEAERYYQDDLAVLETGLPRFGIEEPYVLPSGETRWIQTDKIPLKDESGRVSRLLVMSLDITERKRAEEALREADRRKDEFLALLAHELRNPLAPIRTALDLLGPVVQGDPSANRLLVIMDRQLTHLVRLVDDLMEVSRISRGKIELRKEPTDLVTVLNQAVDTSGSLIDARHHVLRLTLPEESLEVDADPVRLVQVFANLLNNAAKFMSPYGTIRVAARREGEFAVVRVRDDGFGIAADALPHVFDLFTQAEQPRGIPEGGLGIGLALVRSLVELHGGTVTAASDGPDRGSEFCVRLPLLREPPLVQSEPAAEARALSGLRVLVVDDNRDAADSLGLLLDSLQARVRVFYDGASALAGIETFRPDVILLDLGMPGLDGCETARRIRQQPHGQSLKLVALTGWGGGEARRETRLAGFDEHWVKPVSLALLRTLATPIGEPGV